MTNSINNLDYISGIIKNIIFNDPNTSYKIILVEIINTNLSLNLKKIIISGIFGNIKESDSYTFYGSLLNHQHYGLQFQMYKYVVYNQQTKQGLVKYLSGPRFNGIGEQTALKIINYLGVNAIDEILENHSVLDKVNISSKQRKVIISNLENNQALDKNISFLNSLGLGQSLSYKIYDKYQKNTIDIVKNNPYKMVNDISGIGFKKADSIAFKENISSSASIRLKSGILDTLFKLISETGNTFVSRDILLEKSYRLLSDNNNMNTLLDDLKEQMCQLSKDNVIILEDNNVYIPYLYYSEINIAKNIYRLVNSDDSFSYDEKKIDNVIRFIENKNNILYDDTQINVLKSVLKNKIYLLTGGPGTGKTTLINGVIELFAQLNNISLDINSYHENSFPILLAAPTGKAANNINNITKLPAYTIHRLLGISGKESENELLKKNISPLNGKLLIVDEMSMVDTCLFSLLLNSIPNNMHVLLVGDKDQLPSIGPGKVFSDLLSSEYLNKQSLQHIYRQKNNSSIVRLAHEINKGVVNQDLLKKYSDRSFIKCDDSQIKNAITQVVKKAELHGFNVNNIQVLSPIYSGISGIDSLNISLQNVLNPINNDLHNNIKINGFNYRIGDKVINLTNDSENNIFNGEIGTIIDIINDKNAKSMIKVNFSQNIVTYFKKDWNKISMAYCISIHKSQGSEFDVVILPIAQYFNSILNRKLLYTAITRAKKFLIVVGNPQSFISSIIRKADERKTTLIKRIKNIFFKNNSNLNINNRSEFYINEKLSFSLNSQKILTKSLILNKLIDPMIGMNDITPYLLKNK